MPHHLILADWGTTNLRAWAVGAEGTAREERTSGRGLLVKGAVGRGVGGNLRRLAGGSSRAAAGAALFSVMLIIVFAYAIHLRSPIDTTLVDFRTIVVLPSLYPIVALAGAGARGCWTARRRRRRARRPGAHAGRPGRARAPRPRHARLAGQDRARHRLRRAGALAPDQVDPPGAVEDARKLAEDARTGGPGGARAAQRPARARRRRAAAADRDPLGGGALGRADRRRAWAARWTTSGRSPLALRELRWILGGAGQRRALRARVARRRPLRRWASASC